ncbi:MAG: universal stress protein, partial [Boseongicola sp.]|nr:universal stress protein [Boseongicola sp.]
RDRAGAEVAEVLMKQAFEQGADMIVTGAFGHSRVYDFVIGAVTHNLLKDAKLPVLFSA